MDRSAAWVAIGVGAVSAFLLVSAVSTVVGLLGRDRGWLLLGLFAVGGFIGISWLSYRRRSESDRGSIWDVTPRWQYSGLHVESGGYTREEQERAIEEVQRQAGEGEGEGDRP